MGDQITSLFSKVEQKQEPVKEIIIYYGELCQHNSAKTHKENYFSDNRDTLYKKTLFHCFDTILDIKNMFDAHLDVPEERIYAYYELLLPSLKAFWMDHRQSWLYYELLYWANHRGFVFTEDQTVQNDIHSEITITTDKNFIHACRLLHPQSEEVNINLEIDRVLRCRSILLTSFSRLLSANQNYQQFLKSSHGLPPDSFQRKCGKLKSEERKCFLDYCNELQRHTNGIFSYPLMATKEEKVSLLLNYILDEDLFRSTATHLYCYNKNLGYFKRLNPYKEDEEAVLQMVDPDHQQYISSQVVKEVLFRLYRLPSIRVSEKFFNQDENGRYVNCINGVFDLQLRKLYKHSDDEVKDCNFDYCNNANYLTNPQESPQAFKNFIESSLDYFGAEEFLLRIIGNLCCPNIHYKNAFFFIGKPNTGKTLIGNLIKDIIGEESVSGIELHDLDSRFSNSLLSTARINMHMEMSSKPLRNIAAFKTITGRDNAKGEFKGQPLFVFTHKCKLLFGGNLMPYPKDPETSTAFIERVTILLFPDSIPKKKMDLHLYEKMIKEKDFIYTSALNKAQGCTNPGKRPSTNTNRKNAKNFRINTKRRSPRSHDSLTNNAFSPITPATW